MSLFDLASRDVPEAGAQPEPSALDFTRLPPAPTGRPAFDPAFDAAAKEYGVPADVLRGIAFAESRFHPDIISGKFTSPKGAIGLTQWMPDTAKEYGINPLDPVESIFGTAAYLRKSMDKFGGDMEKAIASYNAGPNRYAFKADEWKDRMPKETQGYLETVLGFAQGQADKRGPRKDLPDGMAPNETAGAGRGDGSIQLADLARQQVKPSSGSALAGFADRFMANERAGLAARDTKDRNALFDRSNAATAAMVSAQTDTMSDAERDQQLQARTAAAAHDSAAGAVAGTLGATPNFLRDSGIGLVKGAVGTAVKLPLAVQGLALDLTGTRKAAESIGLRSRDALTAVNEFDNWLSSLKSNAGQARDQRFNDTRGLADTMIEMGANPAMIADKVAESLVGTVGIGLVAGGAVKQAMPRLADAAHKLGLTGKAAEDFIAQGATRIAQIAAPAAEGTQSALDMAGDAQQAGRTLGQYALPALVAGVGTAAIGFAANKVGAKAGIGDLETDIALRGTGVRTAKSSAAGRAERIVMEGGKEALLEEGPQSAQESVWQNIAMGKPWDAGIGKAAATGLVTGFGMGGAHASIASNPVPRVEDQPTTIVVPERMAQPAQPEAVDNIARLLADTQQQSLSARAQAVQPKAPDVSIPVAPIAEPAGSAASGSPVDAGSVGAGGRMDSSPGGRVDPAAAPEPGVGQAGAVADASAQPAAVATLNDSGTLTIKGQPKDLIAMLRAGGVVSILPATNGVLVGANQAEQALQLVNRHVTNNAQPIAAPEGKAAPATQTRGAAAVDATGTIAAAAVPGADLTKAADVTYAKVDPQALPNQDSQATPVLEGEAVSAETEKQPIPQPAIQAEHVLDAAGITGSERLTTLKDIKSGAITLDELARAHPNGEQMNEGPASAINADQNQVPMFARAAGFDKAVEDAITDATRGKKSGAAHIDIGTPSPALQSAGVPHHPMRTTAAILTKALFDHGVTKSALKTLPELLDSPVMVFESDTVPGRFVVVTSRFVAGKPLVVAVSPEKTTGSAAINFVPSLYPKDRIQAIRGWVEKGLLRYEDKKQSPQWLGSAGLQLPSEYRPTKGSQEGSIDQGEGARKLSGSEPGFRRGPNSETGISRADFDAAMAKAFGPSVAKRLEQNGVVIPLADQSSLPAHVVPFVRDGARIYGFYDPKTDRTYAVLSNLSPSMVKGLALHEVGVHYGFEAMLGKDKYAQVIQRVKMMGKAGNAEVKEALAQAKKNSSNERQVPEETLAYLVTNHPEMGLVRDIISRIKAFLFEKFGIGGRHLTADDMVALARASVLHASRTEPGSRRPDFSRGTTEPMASRKDVVGNNEAHPADDETRGAIPKTGEPVTLYYNRNTESAKGMAPAGMDFGQKIEPTGEYMNVERSVELKAPTEKWEAGRITFKNPLVLEHKSTDSDGWKRDLSKMFGGKTGARLADAIKQAGHDGILTYDKDGLSEAVNLNGEKRGNNEGGRSADDKTSGTTQPFDEWFKGSKAVDASGKPLTVYHGTRENFDTFNLEASLKKAKGFDKDQLGFWFAEEPRLAEAVIALAPRKQGANVMPVHLNIERPLVIPNREAMATRVLEASGLVAKGDLSDANTRRPASAEASMLRSSFKNGNTETIRRVREGLERAGYDGIHLLDDTNLGRAWVAFRPEQIRSVFKSNESPAPNSDGAQPRTGEGSDSAMEALARKRAENPSISFSRGGEAEQSGPAPELSPWRDATGRLQFAPGQWLYNRLGEAASPILNRLMLKAASPELRHMLREMKLTVAKAQETAAAVATEANKLSPEDRAMVSDLVEKELAAGTIPPEHAVRLAALINETMGAQTDELVRLGMLTRDSADKWRGQYLPRYYESKLTKTAADAWTTALRAVTGRASSMKGIRGKHLKGRGLYETIPESQLKDYESLGWEVRDPDWQPGLTEDGNVQVWRDFTRVERDNMGEIRDAGFRFVMGYMQTQKDIALGRMFEQMAGDPEMSSRTATEKLTVQVPTTTVTGTGAKVYGKMAGRFVSDETLSQLSVIEESQSEAMQMYRKALGLWKEGKTALNPVSHVNNIISNLTMAHFAGVSYHRADKYLAAMRDFATNAEGVKEAKEAGLFLGTLSEAELMNVLPPELKMLAMKQEGTGEKAGRTAMNLLSFYLRKPMGWAYQAEDTFFRYLIYKDARGRGMGAQGAVDYAQKYIFTYDDLPKGARRIRDSAIPFVSYTYKAIPALLHTALVHPDRFAAPAAVLWAANAAAYAIAAGDDDDSWDEKLKKYLTDPTFRAKAREHEKLDREHLPPWLKGKTAVGSPRAIRLGLDEVTKLPLFIDVSRIIPGGDLFDVSPNAGGVDWLPQPLTPSHPLFTTAVAMLANRDAYFGKDLTDSNDTSGEKFDKRAAWMWRQVTPAIAIGNYHWERAMNALAQATGGEVQWMPEMVGGASTGMGRDGLPVQPKLAAMQTFGIKVRPYDMDKAEQIEGSMKNKMIREIDAELRSLRRLNNLGAVRDDTYEKAKDLADLKKDRLRDNKTVDGDEKP